MTSLDADDGEEENDDYTDDDHGNRQMERESPRDDYEWEEDQPPMRPHNNQFQRFPRPWNPGMRPDFRPEFRPPFWPRNGPRTNRPWMGPRPPQQRFW